jgi:hypothetical protein
MAWHGQQPERRFAVYRNNIASGLSRALAARFPAAEKIVGSAFFTAMAREFVTQHPPRSPVLLGYGDDFAAFVAGFQPAESVPYLADVIRLEAARGHAYHAADVLPLNPATLSALEGGRLAALRFESHPAVSIIRSPHPIVTIWAMNADEMALAPIEIWTPEDALIVRRDAGRRGRPGLRRNRRLRPDGILDRRAAGRRLHRFSLDPALGPHPGLFRIVMREADDLGLQALLMAVELADFEGRAVLGIGDVDPGERDGLREHRRADAAGDDAHLGPADIDRIAVMSRLLPFDLKPDEAPLRCRLAPDQRLLADEVAGLGAERHGEADAGLERVGFIAEFVAGEDEPGLDPQHIERFEA